MAKDNRRTSGSPLIAALSALGLSGSPTKGDILTKGDISLSRRSSRTSLSRRPSRTSLSRCPSQTSLSRRSSRIFPPPPSDTEAKFYYAGLPSTPVLVARTGTTPWEAPTGPEAYRKIKELRPVGDHKLKDVWEDNLALKLHALLDSVNVKWTSTDVVRIGNAGESSAPIILWIGVIPKSLSGNDGVIVASKCRGLLSNYNIVDVDVEIRESIIARSAGPKLLTPTYSSDPTVDIREPLTTTLGLPICAQRTPWAEGTGGFFISDGGNTKRVFLVTARHVVFEPNHDRNTLFKRENNSQPRYNVTLFGDVAFRKYLESIQAEIRGKALVVEHQERRIGAVRGNNQAANRERRKAQHELEEAREAMEELNTFYRDVSTRWATPESRLLGHVILSPPISLGTGDRNERYTEDWAVIEIDSSKVNASNFNGNAIDLGTRIPVDEFTKMMYPDVRNPPSFNYPDDRILKFRGTIPDDEMRRPRAFDQYGDPCLMVIKRGSATGLTIGRANDIVSYPRDYYSDGTSKTSKEWAILPFDSKSGAFSAKGDSGSVIVDGLGRIGGLLTGGAGNTPSRDVTYATPISFLLKRMRENGLRPNINPVLTA